MTCTDVLTIFFLYFADDTTVYTSGSDLDQLCVDESDELRNVNEWMKANRLLNVEKTCFMSFTHAQVDCYTV